MTVIDQTKETTRDRRVSTGIPGLDDILIGGSGIRIRDGTMLLMAQDTGNA